MRRSRKWLGVSAALLVTLALVAGIDPQALPVPIRLAGRLHPLIVHFPVGLLLLALLFRFLARNPVRAISLGNSADLIWDLGAVSAIAVALSGTALSLEGGFAPELIYWHKRLGISVAVTSTGAALLRRLPARQGGSRAWTTLHHLLLAVTTISLVAAGHLGGTMVHGAGYWSAYLPASLGRLVDPFAPEFDPEKGSQDLHQMRIFPDLVRPLLDSRCVSCHGPARQQAGLRLDSHEALLRGGNHGTILEAGQPDASDLLRRVAAPLTEKDHMPPAGHATLNVGETELLRWWIREGASPDLLVVAAETLPSSVDTLLNQRFGYREEPVTGIYALDVPDANPGSIQEAQKAGFSVRRLSEELHFLQIDAVRLGRVCDDERLQVLRPLARQVAWLNLNGTRIGDAGLELIGTMPHLTRLNLSRTETDDAGVARLKGLQYLESLNLYGTQVGDGGLNHLLTMPALHTLYLWQTRTTPDGVEDFRRQAPAVEVNSGLRLQPLQKEERQ